MPRQHLDATAGVLPGIGNPAKPPRSRTWEKSHPTASYRIQRQTAERVSKLGSDLAAEAGDLVDFLLDYALSEYDAGRLKIELKPAFGKFTIRREG